MRRQAQTRRRLAALPVAALLVGALLAAVAGAGCGATGPATSGQDGAGGAVPGSAAATPAGASGAATTPSPSPAASGATPALRVIFVDVGQGDAAALRSGAWSGLVDGGPTGSEAAVRSALSKLGVRRLDLLVVSHLHADHTGGLPALIQRYRPRRAWIVGRPEGGLASALRRAGTVVKQARRGLTARFGRAKATVIAPGALSGDANADSIVLLLQAGGRRVVFTGDSTGAGEDAAGASLARGPPVDVLKVSHHGSRSSTTSSFAAGARPRFAVISVGAGNSYGHPTDEVVQRLRKAGTRVYSTQKNGSVTLTVTSRSTIRWSFTRSARQLTRGAVR